VFLLYIPCELGLPFCDILITYLKKKKKNSIDVETYLDLKFIVLLELGFALRSLSRLLVSLLDLYSKHSVIFPMQVMLSLSSRVKGRVI
jgi:hypothetical protein